MRAIVAIAFTASFYLLALTIVAALLWVPYAEIVYWHRIDGFVARFCILAGLALLAGVAPRRDRFQPPGPRVDEASEPRLVALVREVATATHQAMPREIYLIDEVNAWVAIRGGVLGFGGRRVMGIGVPLLQVLPTYELKAILAHEFGHYAAGDAKIDAWVYGTRAAIRQTVMAVESSAIKAPFVM